MSRVVNYWLPVFVWMAIIFSFSSAPSLGPHLGVEPLDTIIRKLAHIGEYSVLALLLIRALQEYFPRYSLQDILELVFLAALLYAISDEFHQTFIYGREGTFRDVIIDCIGITLVCLYLTRQKEKRVAKEAILSSLYE